MIAKINGDRALALARDVLDIEADAVRALRDQLDDGFVGAVDFILGCRGRVVVSGIGKSGHVARKLAATLASTGTPAFFVHPAEASHGDLGMVTADDVFLALSNSGETEELVAILPLIKRIGAKLIAMTGRPSSSLAQLADVHLNSAVSKEACPAPPPRSRSAMRSRSRCWTRAASGGTISPAHIRAARSAGVCSLMYATSCAPATRCRR
jgi:arabinose-5-phosphate isomerase